MGLWAWVFARTWSLSLEPQALSLSLELEYEPWVLALILYPIMSHISQKLALVGGGTIGSNSHCNWQKDFNCKGEDTVQNISFRIFHETQFNAYFITYNWFHEILVKYVKRIPSWTIMLFFPDYFTREENRRNSFSEEFRCSSTINEFRTGTLCTILNYSTEQLKVLGNYR